MRPEFAGLAALVVVAPVVAVEVEVRVEGERKPWHKVTLSIDGPEAREADDDPNPFTDYRLTVTFRHQSGSPTYRVPGYFAADGDATNSSADSGHVWRAHLAPDAPGRWDYAVSFREGKGIALDDRAEGEPVVDCDGKSGSFRVEPGDKAGPDFRARGRLEYAGSRYLRFAGTGEPFLKAGADAPETLLAYRDFDGTATRKAPLKSWGPHVRDWTAGDPTWKDGKGKGLIGALNYLASQGCNAYSFLTYNVGGDGDNVWPFAGPEQKFHYDCSKLDQWQVVFDHGQALGLFAHFKLQEQENDDDRKHNPKGLDQAAKVPAALDGGDLGPERTLYLRELVARFGYLLALNWNLGEENTQSADQQRAMAGYLRATDPYPHSIVVHTFPNRQDAIYRALLGDKSALTGASLQNGWEVAHERTLKWIEASAEAGRPWVVCNDEQNPAGLGVPPDPGFEGKDGVARDPKTPGARGYTLDDIRKRTLWGTLTAGGAGVEYYFGYQLPQNDILCEDFRSRERSWEYARIALEFFNQHVPFAEMANADALVGNPDHIGKGRYGFAKPGEVYLVYLPDGGSVDLDLADASGPFRVQWFDPRRGGPLVDGDVRTVSGGSKVTLGPPPSDPGEDWAVLIRK